MTGNALELVGVPDGLVEERGEASLVSLGALAAVNHAGVGNVAFVVRGGNVLAVPARGEEDLGTDTVGAIGVHVVLVGEEVAVARAFGSLVVVEAVEAKRLLAECELGLVVGSPGRGWRVGDWASEVAETAVTRKHLEALGESLDVVAEKEVVCEHTADLRDNLDLAILVDEVEGGGPVGRLVVVELARGALGLTEHVVGSRLSEVCHVLATRVHGNCLRCSHPDKPGPPWFEIPDRPRIVTRLCARRIGTKHKSRKFTYCCHRGWRGCETRQYPCQQWGQDERAWCGRGKACARRRWRSPTGKPPQRRGMRQTSWLAVSVELGVESKSVLTRSQRICVEVRR